MATMRSARGSRFLAIFVLGSALFSAGCAPETATGILGAIANGLSGIGLSQGVLGGGLGGFNPTGPFQPISSGLGGSIPQPGSLTPGPNGPNLLPPNVSSATGQQCINELASRGIQVRGSFNDAVLQNAVICARQVRVENTQNLTIDFCGGGGGGMWSTGGNGGYIEMYSIGSPGILLHEICHHATLYHTSVQGERVGQNIMSWIRSKVGGSEGSWPTVVVPTDYARTDEAEFQAEYLSHLRIIELRLPWEQPEYADFNPPAELKTISDEFYDPAGASPAGGGTTPAAGAS